MRRIITLVVVASVMAAMMLAMAMPAFAARGEQGGAAANCGPPGRSHSDFAKDPGSAVEAWGEPPGQSVSQRCAPGHQEDEPPI